MASPPAERIAHLHFVSSILTERLLVVATAAVAIGIAGVGGSAGLLVLPVVVVGVLLTVVLRHRRPTLGAYTASPVAATSVLDVLAAPTSFLGIGLVLAAGVILLLWVGLPDADVPPVTRRDLLRSLDLPLIGGVVAWAAASIPLLNAVGPATIVVMVFAGIALLIVFLAELTTEQPPTPA